MQSEIGVTLLETKDHQQTPEARAEAWDGGTLSASEGTTPADTLILDLWPPERGVGPQPVDLVIAGHQCLSSGA